MAEASTLLDLLAAGGDDAIAISAPDRESLTYGGLRALARRTVGALNRLGLGRNDRVAIVLPNGPEMASAFVTIACGATTAPLNPAYRKDEFAFYMKDIAAKALVVEQGSESPAVAAARESGIAIHEIVVGSDDPAGGFSFPGDDGCDAILAEADDVALLLHTSGTTSRPKIVPLTHGNLCASAANIRAALNLTGQDRCLNIMPLFHIHGLIAAVSATLGAGASVYCTPGFNALRFFSWLSDARPSWYTAVPTMHQAILSRAARNADAVSEAGLRFIRSSSSSLPPQVMAALEATFDAPVIESYCMTEATHQMASNPLPPLARKPGTVGIAAGPEVSVMSENGELLKPGATGEIVIRGPNVTPGYEANPTANAEAFIDGWFRTGDQGVIDPEGYLTITGRLEEIINRGGEKISPREVDEVLMDHPAVAQVVTFAMPHDKLGEEVAAAVVLRDGESAAERDIRDFVETRLADFKVPRKILFIDEITKGSAGKLQRIGLAEKLGLR
ncbi:MAG: acyl--CoA ligase [Alphaproteobacteria bacterium]